MADYWAPFAKRHPVALRDSQKNTITPVGLVLHTAVSNRELVVPTGLTRWHFYVYKDGTTTQFFPVNHMAAAQLDGNEWSYGEGWEGFVSVETWDGAGTAVWPNYRSAPDSGPAWTPQQVEALARIAAWLHTEHGIPLVKANAARDRAGVEARGIGYHRQFQNTAPHEWTSSHACPGSRRIAQVPTVIARAQALAGDGTTTAPKEDDDMKLSDQMDVPQWLIDRFPDDKGMADGKMSIQTALASGYAHARTARQEVADLDRYVHDAYTDLLKNLKQTQTMVRRLEAIIASQQPTDPPATTEETTYTIQSGDTLAAIAAAHGVSVVAIAERNNLSHPDRIFPGQIIIIPGRDT